MAAHGIWNTPGLRAFLAACVDEGKGVQEIRQLIADQFGIHTTSSVIWNAIDRQKQTVNTRLADLVTPPEGFAMPAASPWPRHEHAKGWEPRVEISGDEAVAITDVITDRERTIEDEDELIRGWALDPAEWRIIPPLSVNRWQTTLKTGKAGSEKVVQKWNFQFKAKLAKRDKHPDLAPLVEEIRKHKRVKLPSVGGDNSLVACWSDVQLGKRDGDGVEGTARRCLEKIDAVEDHVAGLRRIGAGIGTLYVFGLGDLIEQCSGFYAQQAFRTDLNRRDQVKVMRRIILKSIERWSTLFERVVVGCIGGNHGENRDGTGKSYTDFADNDDVAIFEQIAEICSENRDRYGHVSFRIPNNELSLTFDISGVITGITHGHVAGNGSGLPQKRILDWWMRQSHGMQPIGDATILINGHFHHFSVLESSRKTSLQCPALEGGSEWFENMSGQRARPGLLTAVIGKNVSEAGYRWLEIL